MILFRTTITLMLLVVSADVSAKPTVAVVIGAPGAEEYATKFHEWGKRWQSAAERGGADFKLLGHAANDLSNDRDALQKLLADASKEESTPLWLVLIGHGTFDGQAAKFNLRGPDVEAAELAQWLAPLERPLAVINCASASAPFINRLAGANRVVITATKSGNEQNFARFGRYLSAAIADREADLDKDDQVSLLEAYLTACRQVKESYEQDARLATEHALLDDNGDGLGTPAEWFRGLRATQRAKEGAALDGTQAHQFHLVASDFERRLPDEMRKRRNQLELKIAAMRAKKESLADDEYYLQMEKLLVRLAKLYQSASDEETAAEE